MVERRQSVSKVKAGNRISVDDQGDTGGEAVTVQGLMQSYQLLTGASPVLQKVGLLLREFPQMIHLEDGIILPQNILDSSPLDFVSVVAPGGTGTIGGFHSKTGQLLTPSQGAHHNSYGKKGIVCSRLPLENIFKTGPGPLLSAGNHHPGLARGLRHLNLPRAASMSRLHQNQQPTLRSRKLKGRQFPFRFFGVHSENALGILTALVSMLVEKIVKPGIFSG